MSFVKVIIEFVMDILETIVFIGSIFIVTYLFLVAPNQVKGASMEPSFHSGDYILTSKMSYRLRNFQRGDIIVFKAPTNPDIEYIKRIIGLPGDVVVIKEGEVFVNNHQLNEPYIAEKTNIWETGFAQEGVPMTVPADDLFVMGDNRTHSSDSREFGFITEDSVIGQVFFRYFPANAFGQITNPFPTDFRSLLPITHLAYN